MAQSVGSCTHEPIHCLNRRNGCAGAVLTIPSLSATHGMDELGIQSIMWQQIATSGAVNSERSYNHTVRKSVSTLKEQQAANGQAFGKQIRGDSCKRLVDCRRLGLHTLCTLMLEQWVRVKSSRRSPHSRGLIS